MEEIKQENTEKKEEHKEDQSLQKQRKSFFAFLRKSDKEENKEDDWKFGLFFVGLLILMFFQMNFLILAAWAVVWVVLLAYLNEL